MDPVLIVGPLTDLSLAMARLLIQKGMQVYVITNNLEEWRTLAPDIFTGQNVVTLDSQLTFSPSYIILIPASQDIPEALLAYGGKKVSVLSHEVRQQTPSYYSPVLFSSYQDVEPSLSVGQRGEEILRHLFSFGGDTTIFTSIQKLEIPEPPKQVVNPEPVEMEVPAFLKRPEVIPMSPKKRKRRGKWGVLLVIILFVLALPFTILGIATALTLVGVKLVTIGEMSLARTAFAASGSVSSVASLMPAVGESGYMLQRITTTGERGTYVLEDVNKIMDGVFGGTKYPLTELSANLQKELLVIHRELSFLEAEILKENNLFSNHVPLKELTKLRVAAAAGADIAGRLPTLLGVDSQKTYMVLLQNNMELRPTGGFIGSFALVNFSGGRLIDAPVYDVYSADGQLKGHVEPPVPIKEYLGEANWYLRDSNWDADFPTSANRAEWFLDKTLGIPVDGVIAIDLEFVRQLVAEQGKLEIADFNMQLTKDNFYEVLQNEVHKDFFPGSRKKTAVLTATMNALMNNLLKQVENKDVSLAAVASQALAGRHIQMNLKDPVLQQQVQVLGWAGEAKPSSCSDNCEQIWVGMVEANVGVNKANYFIQRSAELNSVLINNQWEHELAVTLHNTARGDDVNKEHNYETYLRVMTSEDANFDRVLVQTSTGRKSMPPEVTQEKGRAEGGVFVDVPAGETRVVTFLWSDKASVTTTEMGSVEIYWRKQAGVEAHPVKVSVNLPGGREFEYNSSLSEDFKTEILLGMNND